MLILAGVIGGTSLGARAQSASEVQFSGSAAAVGVNMHVNIPGAPATDVPVDSGGPTAQAEADSSGFQSTAYAAFPDPGEFILTVPGLVPGLVEGGVSGLPGIPFPSPPDYPFYVQTNPSNPKESVGSGPFALNAESTATSSRAEAATGLRQSVAGDFATVRSSAVVAPSDDGTVLAEGVSVLEGLRVGPLTIGSITSIARQTLDEYGEVTTTTDLVISGAQVGGIGVNLREEGLDVLGVPVPLPLNDTLADLLESADMSVQFLEAQEFEDRVVAPGLRITMPYTMPLIPQVGQFSGTATMTIGQATASLVAGTSGGLDAPADIPLDSTVPGGSVALPDTSFPTIGDEGGLDTPPLPTPGPESAPGLTDSSGSGVQAVAAIGPESLIGIESVYLVVVAGAVLALAGGNLIQRLGGRAV